ncbi:HNH endonuclease [Gemmobacter megaterium]|nr:HNH endonuclease signature motif containing protein [Gemmobacter megaterium]
MSHKAILIWNFLFQVSRSGTRTTKSSGLARAVSFQPGNVLSDGAHSLLMKSNERTRAMDALKNIRRQKMIEQGGCCYYCGLAMWENALKPAVQARGRSAASLRLLQCTAEHLHPRSEGGADTADNIVAACRFCNSRRHRRKQPQTPEAYRAYVQRRMAAGRWLAAQMAP